MLKRRVSWLVLILVFMMIFQACSQGINNNTSKNASNVNSGGGSDSTAEDKTITFWYIGKGGVHDEYFDQVGEDFNKLNPHIKVETVRLTTNVAELETRLNAAELSGTSPDVLSGFVVLAGSRGTKGQFLALNDYIEEWGEKDDFYDAVLNVGTIDGNIIGIPYFPEPHLFVYRKDFFEEAGLDPEKPPITWDELAEYAELLTVKDDDGNVVRAGFDIPTSQPNSNFFEAFMRQNGSKVNDMEKQLPAFDDQASIEALEFIVDLYNKNVSIPYNFSQADTSPFLNQRSAMAIVWNSAINNLLTTNPELEDKIGIAPMFTKKEKAYFTGYTLFYIDANSKHADESWEFVKYLSSSDSMKERFEKLNIPVVRKSLSDWMVEQSPDVGPVLIEAVEYGYGRDALLWASIENKYLAQSAYEEALHGIKTPEQALKDGMQGLLDEIARIQ